MQTEKLQKAQNGLFTEEPPELYAFDEIDSTNSEALRKLEQGVKTPFLVVGESQTAGRGRRGRAWLSSKNAGLYLSVVYAIPESVEQLQALSLVTALAVREALAEQLAVSLQLKWPNDLLYENKKIAGILLERQTGKYAANIVFGIGINLSLPDADKATIGRPVIDLESVTNVDLDNSLLTAAIVAKLKEHIDKFCRQGFAQFEGDWNRHDRYIDADIVVEVGAEKLIGKCLGVNELGELMLLSLNGKVTLSSGEIFPSLSPLNDELSK